MGFFGSRKTDDDYVSSGEKTVVQVIRSRFYGKGKGKEREDGGGGTFVDPASSAAQTLSHSLPAHASSPVLATSPQKKANARLPHGSASKPMPSTSSMLPPPSIRSTTTRSAKENHNSGATSSPRKPADNATTTLAQRLNELATANADGLLNDDEYRMLRQNLFERFATSSTVPSEAPVVPATPRHQTQSSESSRMSTRPSSNFVVEVPRSPSVRSRSSVSSFFGRSESKTLRRTPAGSKDFSDTSSMFSSTSTTSNIFKFGSRLKKKSSSSSIASEISRPGDTMSIASRRTTGENSYPRSTTSSIRRVPATPPSSFHGSKMMMASESKYADDVFDEENLQGSGQIKQELAAVEAERKRLMDAFNGLELTTVTKRKHLRQATDGREDSTWTLIPETRSLRRLGLGVDSDATSIRSGTSGKRPLRQKTSSNLVAGSSLHRKNSISSMSSAGKSSSRGLAPPPVPSLPSGISVGIGFNGSSSSINLTRSTGHLPMTSVPEDEVKQPRRPVVDRDHEMEQEMEDIRRRREEVSLRYDARLEYLRAKLKGAQLHEKLMRK